MLFFFSTKNRDNLEKSQFFEKNKNKNRIYIYIFLWYFDEEEEQQEEEVTQPTQVTPVTSRGCGLPLIAPSSSASRAQ